MSIKKKISLWLASVVTATAIFTPQIQAATVDLGDRTSPGSFTYSNILTASTNQFTDWYAFSINSSTINAFTTSLKLTSRFGIANMETQLFKGYLTPTGVHNDGLLATAKSTKTTNAGSTVTLNTLAPIQLPEGHFLLQVRGIVTGTSGGSYAGLANLSAVPLPGVLPLMLSGLGLFGIFLRRKS